MKVKIITFSDGSKSFVSGNMKVEKPGLEIVDEEERDISDQEHQEFLINPKNSSLGKELNPPEKTE